MYYKLKTLGFFLLLTDSAWILQPLSVIILCTVPADELVMGFSGEFRNTNFQLALKPNLKVSICSKFQVLYFTIDKVSIQNFMFLSFRQKHKRFTFLHLGLISLFYFTYVTVSNKKVMETLIFQSF